MTISFSLLCFFLRDNLNHYNTFGDLHKRKKTKKSNKAVKNGKTVHKKGLITSLNSKTLRFLMIYIDNLPNDIQMNFL